jgi:hypothetical protein
VTVRDRDSDERLDLKGHRMLVGEVKEVARHWVADEGVRLPGFFGAYFSGSVNGPPDDAPHPATSDVDVHVILERASDLLKLGKFVYQGVLLEVSYIARDELGSAEAVLGNGPFAAAFRFPCVILDPSGQLTALQEAVSRDYAKRRYVRLRVERAASRLHDLAQSLDEAVPLHDQMNRCVFGAGIALYPLLAAGLKNPTVRKRYVAAREVLAEYGRLDFHEQLLALLGCAEMTRERVEHHLAGMTAAYDAAQCVPPTTPYRFRSDVGEAARPISVDGTRELIERGLHREAVFWIAATYARCRHVFDADAPELLPRFDPAIGNLLADLGIGSFAGRRTRCEEIEASVPRVLEVAEQIMAANPAIE